MQPERISRSERRAVARERAKNKKRRGSHPTLTRAQLLYGGLGTVAIFVGGSAYWLIHQDQDNPVKKTLNRWDMMVTRDPKSFERIERQIARMATDLFAEELGFDGNKVLNKIHFFEHNELVRNLLEAGRCTAIDTNNIALGNNDIYTGDIKIDRSQVLYEDNRFRRQRAQPASVAFCAIGHEEVHADSEYVIVNQDSIIAKSGFGLEAPIPNLSKPGMVCGGLFREQLEEGHAHAVALAVLAKVDMDDVFRRESVDKSIIWANTYDRAILGPVFAGDYRKAQEYHRRSDDEGFFKEVGLKRGVPLDQAAAQGELYLISILK